MHKKYMNTCHTRIHKFSFFFGGGGAEPKTVYNLFDFKNTVMKIMSKSPSRHLVRLQGKLKLTEKEKIYIHVCFFCYIFQ
jgi:hypothetical protein